MLFFFRCVVEQEFVPNENGCPFELPQKFFPFVFEINLAIRCEYIRQAHVFDLEIIVAGIYVFDKLQKVSEQFAEEIKVVVLDDLTNRSREHVPSGMKLVVGDVCNQNIVEDVFSRHHIFAIIHTVCGDENQTRDLDYAGDIASAIVQALPLIGYHTINVSTGTEMSINELIHSFERAIGHKAEVQYVPPRLGDIQRSVLSNEELVQTLHMKPEMTLEQGIAYTFVWYKHQM